MRHLLLLRSPELVEPCGCGLEFVGPGQPDLGQPGNLAFDVLALAAKDPSDDGSGGIGVAAQRDGLLHGCRQPGRPSQDM